MTRYVKTTWINNSEPDIDADNLNKIEQGIYAAEGTIIGGTSDTTPGRLDEKVKQSLEIDGDYKAHLKGDLDSPGADKVWGTDEIGDRGWKSDTGLSAFHDDEIGEVSALDEKETPIDTDIIIIEDSAAYFAKKKVQMSNLPGGTDPNAIHDNVAAEINAISEKVNPVGADILVIEDSEDSNNKKKVQITNLPGGADADAIHDNVTGEIAAITEKTTPVDADIVLIEDSAASNAKKKLSWSNIKATLKTYFDTVYAALTHASTHQNGGADEISVAGLSGELADNQPPKAHASSHKSGGSDILYQYHRYVWHFNGDCEVAASPIIFRVGVQIETVVGVYMTVPSGDEPTGASLQADIKEDGVTIFSTKPEIDASANEEDGNEVVSDSSLAADAQLSAEITQIGSTLPGSNLTLILLTKEPIA